MRKYNSVVEAYKAAYPDVKKQVQLSKAQTEWNRVKNSQDLYDALLLDLKGRAARLKATSIQWWAKTKKKGVFKNIVTVLFLCIPHMI